MKPEHVGGLVGVCRVCLTRDFHISRRGGIDPHRVSTNATSYLVCESILQSDLCLGILKSTLYWKVDNIPPLRTRFEMGQQKIGYSSLVDIHTSALN